MALSARLHIETAVRNGKTVLKKTFFTPPFKIADVTEDKARNELRLMLRSSSPGVLDGDAYHIKINVLAGCHLTLETQSYQRLFSMKAGAAQLMEVHVENGSSFSYLPHPLVPHEAAVFSCRNRLFLGENSSLTWGEVISCGRKLNGEVFKFFSYHSITEIFQAEKLVVKESILLKPSQMNLSSVGHLEGYSHQASLIFINNKVDVTLISCLVIEHLKQVKNIEFGITALPVNGIIVRLLGYTAEQLFTLVKQVALLCEEVCRPIILKDKTHVV